MSSTANERAAENGGPVSAVRERVNRRTVGMLLTGVLGGYSLSILGTDAVAVPVVGSVSGTLVGTVGLVAFFVAYQQFGCCGGSKDCGCSGDCGDSCSLD